MKGIVWVAVGCALLGGEALAQSANPVFERSWWQSTDLREHIGRTYLQTFLAEVVGIHAEIVADFDRTITIADADTVVATIKKFDPSVGKKVVEDYFDGEKGFVSVIGRIAGRAMPIVDLRDTLAAAVDAATLSKWSSQELSETADMVLLASGSGTLVRLDDDNYFYNVGFHDPIRFSGRGYGVAKERKALDPNDAVFLRQMGAYFGPDNDDPSPFYRTMFDLLTNSDPRRIAELPPDVQVLITDFMTIYTAELDRNNMAKLSPDKWAWQSDLAELTLLAAYGGASGMALKNGKLIRCSSFAYAWEHGVADRAQLMQAGSLITAYEIANNPKPVYDVIALTPLTDPDIVAFVGGDVFRRVLTFLNRPESQEIAQANAGALTAAMVALLSQVRSDQAAITAYMRQETGTSDVTTCDADTGQPSSAK